MNEKESTLNKAWEQQLINFGVFDEEAFGKGLSVGYDARDNETCEWQWDEELLRWNRGCGSFHEGALTPPCCSHCGRKINEQ